MATQVKVGSFNVKDTGNGVGNTLEIVCGFNPTAVILFHGGSASATTAVGSGNMMAGVGLVASISDRRSFACEEEDAITPTDANNSNVNNAIVREWGTGTGSLDVSAMTAAGGGFTIITDAAFTLDARVTYLALGGDVTNAKTGYFINPAGTGDTAYSGVGFQPDALLVLCVDDGTAETGNSSYGFWGIGAASSASAMWNVGSSQKDAADPSNTIHWGNAINVGGLASAYFGPGATALLSRFVLKSFDADGFTLTWNERNASGVWYYLALKGGQYYAGNMVSRTDTTATGITGVGFTPKALLFASAGGVATAADAAVDYARNSIGAYDGTTQAAHAFSSDDAIAASSECAVAYNTANVYAHLDLADALDGAMQINSLDADGFTMQMSDADPLAAFIGYLAIGDSPAAAGGDGSRGVQRGLEPGEGLARGLAASAMTMVRDGLLWRPRERRLVMPVLLPAGV